jgi:Peptidase M50B-like
MMLESNDARFPERMKASRFNEPALTGSVTGTQPGLIARWGDRIDRWINYAKWPVAVLAVIVTPPLCWSALTLTGRILQAPRWNLVPFLAGVVLFVFAWRKVIGDWAIVRWIVTMEHEVTHALFAFLTGHKIVSIRATMGAGGEVRYAGGGNWLITAAPYFFPTAAIVLSLIAYFLPFSGLPWGSFLLGVALGYHFVSTYRETHGDQSDLKELGKTFSWMFLPAANIATVLFLVAFAYNGTESVQTWLSDVKSPFTVLCTLVYDFVTS